MTRPPPSSTLFPYTPLSRSVARGSAVACASRSSCRSFPPTFRTRSPPRFTPRQLGQRRPERVEIRGVNRGGERVRSEEHTSELQSLAYIVCRLLLEKKKKRT